MRDAATGAPHTAHTLNVVPMILAGAKAGTVVHDGRLADVAPTILDVMGLPQPAEMTGQSLVSRDGAAIARRA
jgi:2,3-bisphosphoglycerate-independent phosphoglycerate mutase